MYPNNNQYTTPVDYLNQIAPNAPKKSFLNGKPPILLAGTTAVLLLIIVMSIGSLLSGGPKPTAQLAARLLSTETVASGATTNLKNSQLRALNSDLKLYLTNTIRDITPLLTNQNINIKSLDKNIVASESNADMLSRLEDARLNAVYDRTYAREMAYQLDTVLTLMLQINNDTNSKSLKSFLTDARSNLEPIQQQFDSFNADNG
jgi:hypothetical protein